MENSSHMLGQCLDDEVHGPGSGIVFGKSNDSGDGREAVGVVGFGQASGLCALLVFAVLLPFRSELY